MNARVEKDGTSMLWVKVRPRSRENRVCGWNGEGYLEILVTAIPEAGAANRACVKAIAKALGVPRNRVELDKGFTSRYKRFRVNGLGEKDVRERLGGA